MVGSIGSALRRGRDLSIIDLLNAIWNRFMGQRYARFQDAVQKLAVTGARYQVSRLILAADSSSRSPCRAIAQPLTHLA